MKKTFNELIAFNGTINALYAKTPELKDTKFGYAAKRFVEKNLTAPFQEFNDALNNARIENALEDEKTKAIITDEKSPRGFAYSKEGLKAVIKAEKEITTEWESKEFEIEPYISTYIPENLTESEKEILTGLII